MNAPLPRANCLAQEVRLRPRVIGSIRLGKKAMTNAAKQNPRAVEIFEEGEKAGLPYKTIEASLERECQIRHGLYPVNTEHFTIRESEFNDPRQVKKMLELYGEDRGDGLKLYKFPVVFPWDDINQVMPHRFSAYRARQIDYFSEYDTEGNRYCMQYVAPEMSELSTRAKKFFGGRPKRMRQDQFISSACIPENCPQYQKGECSLDLKLQFLIPGIQGAGVFEGHSTSQMSLQNWYSTLSLVMGTQGTLRNITFELTKKLMEISYVNDKGGTEKSKQWITVLNSDISLPELMLQSDASKSTQLRLVASAENAANALCDDKNEVVITEPSELEKNRRFELLQSYLKDVKNSDRPMLEKSLGSLAGYLKYLNVKQEKFSIYAAACYSDDWSKNQKTVDRLIDLVASKTEKEMHHLVSQII